MPHSQDVIPAAGEAGEPGAIGTLGRYEAGNRGHSLRCHACEGRYPVSAGACGRARATVIGRRAQRPRSGAFGVTGSRSSAAPKPGRQPEGEVAGRRVVSALHTNPSVVIPGKAKPRPGTGEARRLWHLSGACPIGPRLSGPGSALRAVREDERRGLRSIVGAAYPPLSASPTSPPQGGREFRGARPACRGPRRPGGRGQIRGGKPRPFSPLSCLRRQVSSIRWGMWSCESNSHRAAGSAASIGNVRGYWIPVFGFAETGMTA